MKTLKHISFTILTSAFLFSCTDSLKDTYDELGEIGTSIKSDIQYTLTDDDYKTLGLESSKTFESFEKAEELIPVILNKKLPNSPGAKAALMVAIYNDNNTIVDNLFSAEEIELETADYPTENSGAFHPDESAIDLLPNIISSKITSPIDGEFYKITYNNFTEEPVRVSAGEVVNYDFTNETFNGWTAYSIEGDEVWKDATGFGNIQMSGYSGSAKDNEDWLVSQEIDLTGETNLKFQIDENLRFGTDLSNLKVMVSENFAGDVATATWTEVNITNRTIDTNHSLSPSDIIDFSAFDNKTIHLAFKYISTTSDSMRWLIGKTTISKGDGDEYTGATETITAYYTYNGSEYVLPDNTYELTTEDYDAMGTESGKPGQYNNFSSSVSPDGYLPVFLANKFSYPTESEQIIVFYKYFSGGVQTRFDLYAYENGAWITPETNTDTEIRFTHKKGAWVSDNPVLYTFTNEDFEWLATSSLKDDTSLTEQLASAANYNNFDRRPGGSAYWADDMILKVLNAFLKDKFPDSEEGIQYAISAETYTGSSSVEEFRVVLNADGEYEYTAE